MKSTFRKFALLLVLASTPLALAADRERMKDLGQKFICVCGGCGQLLNSCNHIGCPSREAMMSDLAEQIDQGKSDSQIAAFFIDKYGTTVLSAPPASGFNLTAWVMPFFALALGAAVVVYFVRRFRQSWRPAPAAAGIDPKYQQKLEEELEKYTPED